MHKIIAILFIVGLFSCTGKKSGNKPELINEINQPGQFTTIEFDTEMHDFGKVKSGEILTYSFVFSNKGETNLTIKNAQTDCGCLQANTQNELVKPGEKGIIEVKFNSAGLFGKQLKTVEIQSNSKEPKHLIIFAEVENDQIEIGN